MEASTSSSDVDEYKTKSVKDISITSSKPLVHLYGSQYLHKDIIKTIKEASDIKNRQIIRYKSHDFEDLVDLQEYPEATRSEGLMRTSWFYKVYNDVPSVMILVYDWSKDQGDIAWNLREDDIKFSISKLREKSREAKLMLLVFLSENDSFNAPHNRIETKISSLKRNTELEPKSIFLITNGLNGFGSLVRKFEKTLFDYSIYFYKELKNMTKGKQRKIPKDDSLNVRYNFKNGYFTEIIKDASKAVKFYQESYTLLCNIKEGGYSQYSSTELRDVADLIVLKLLYWYFKHYNVDSALDLFKRHYNLFSRQVNRIKDKIKFIELNWRLDWMKTFGQMLQKVQMNKVERFKDFWYYPGYYFMNCLHLMQQKRKTFQTFNYIDTVEDVKVDDFPEAKDDPMHPAFTKLYKLWFDPHDFQSQYLIKTNDFIGKNPIISMEPNPMTSLDGEEFKKALIMYKVYNELSFDYESEFESMLKKTLDWYTNQEHAERMVDYIYSVAADFYFKQENYKKCREMKSFVAKRLARQNWNNVAVELIENVKVCSLKMHDDQSFVQSEFELINVKKEDIEVKKQRINRIIEKFENSPTEETKQSKNPLSYKFTMNNPLIRVFARFDWKRAEIFDSVNLCIRIVSAIDLKFNKLYINFNDKGLNKEIFNADGEELQLRSDQTYQNDLTIFIKSQIESELKLDTVVIEKVNNGNMLSLMMIPLPDINIDNLIFGNKDEADVFAEKVSEDTRQGLHLKISETRQKVDLNIAYKERIFLGELVPIDFTFKCRQGCEIIEASLYLSDISNEIGTVDEKERKVRGTSSGSMRKSTSLPITDDFDPSDDPFEVAERSSNLKETGPDIYYWKPSDQEFNDLPQDESQMEFLEVNSSVEIPNFDESHNIRLRICPKFYNEGYKNFKVTLKYKIIKVYEESRSDPIPMTMTRVIKMKWEPPFQVSFDYEVKDWLTNELNLKDSEVNNNNTDSFIKVPVDEDVPLSVHINCVSEKAISIKNVDLDIVTKDVISKVSKNSFHEITGFEEGDTIWTGFVIKPIKWTNDTGQYADVLIEWYRKSELTGKIFHNICRLPTKPLSVVSSPLCVDIRTPNTRYSLCEVFTLEVEVRNTTEIIMDIWFELINSSDVMISGERRSYINLTPLDSEIFKYTWIPLREGLIQLPAIKVGKDEGYQYIQQAERNILVINN